MPNLFSNHAKKMNQAQKEGELALSSWRFQHIFGGQASPIWLSHYVLFCRTVEKQLYELLWQVARLPWYWDCRKIVFDFITRRNEITRLFAAHCFQIGLHS